MALVTPDAQDNPTYPAQAVLDKVDMAALAKLGEQTGVVSGCTVTPHASAYSVDVAAGTIIYQGTEQAVSAATALAPNAPSTSDRRDIVQVSSTGTVSIKAGAPCGYTAGQWTQGCGFNPPVKPVPDSANILLGEITIPGTYTSTTTVSSNMVVDKTAKYISPTSTAQGESDVRANSLSAFGAPTSAVNGGGQRYATMAQPTQAGDGIPFGTPGSVLAVATYSPTGSIYFKNAASSASLAAIDTTNLTLSFVAPPSGNALIDVEIPYQGFIGPAALDQSLYFCWVTHGTTTQVSEAVLGFNMPLTGTGTNLYGSPLKRSAKITGLTPATSYQVDLAWFAGSGTGGSQFVGAESVSTGAAATPGSFVFRAVAL